VPLLAVSFALLGAACSCPKNTTLVDDFEGCTGTCGWTITGSGSARVVSTILPGEHGLELPGDTTAQKTLSSGPTVDRTFDVSLVAACPAGLTLSLTIGGAGGDQEIMVALSLDRTPTSSGDLPDYSGAEYLPLTGPVNLPTGITSAPVRAVTVHATAGSPCTIDLVEISATTPCAT
jgi:hypothetical protein